MPRPGKISKWMTGKKGRTWHHEKPFMERQRYRDIVRELLIKPPHRAPLAELIFLTGYTESTMTMLVRQVRNELVTKRIISSEVQYMGGARAKLSKPQRETVQRALEYSSQNGRVLDVKRLLDEIRPAPRLHDGARSAIVLMVHDFNRGVPPGKKVYPVTKGAGGILS